jgi:Flp pilus assembly protein TadG
MIVWKRLKRLMSREERGAAAAEFAMVLPVFLVLMFGAIHLCLMMYAVQQLDFATEATARCMVVAQGSGYSSATCYTNTGTNSATAYFDAHYLGPTATPTLSQLDETQTCNASTTKDTDYQVVATVNYNINAVFFTKSVPLKARACFPHT